MTAMGIIFANIYDSSLGELTNKRTMASLPFGGRYRQIDFALSNMTCCGIRRIGIISRYNYQSLMNHIGSGEEWDLELAEGGLEFLTPFSTSTHGNSFRGKIDALNANLSYLEFGSEEYVVLSDAGVLFNIDLNQVLEAHIASGKDITVITKAGIANGKKQLDMAIKLDKDGGITDMAVDYAASPGYLASMGLFVISRSLLIHHVRESAARSLFRFERDFVLRQYQNNNLTVNIYPFEGVALYNESTEEYYRGNLAAIDRQVSHDLFSANHPIYTKVRDRVPTYYGENSCVENCIVADGCILEGSVRNSVLFRTVSVGAGCQIEDCVIMNDSVIGEGCELKHAILDKDVIVHPGAKLIGTPTNPVIIKRGDSI